MLHTERCGTVNVVRLSTAPITTSVDVSAPEQTWGKLEALVNASPSANWLIDVSEERIINSEALAVMIGIVRHVQSAGGRIALAGCLPGVVNVLNSMRLSKILPLYSDLPTGLAAFANPTQPAP